MMGSFSIDGAPINDTQQSDEHGVLSAWTIGGLSDISVSKHNWGRPEHI